MTRPLKSKPNYLDLHFVYAYTLNHSIIAPVALNENNIPVGVLVYSKKERAEKRAFFENGISAQSIPRAEIYQLGIDIEIPVYLQASLHMFYQAFKVSPFSGMLDVPYMQFERTLVFIDPSVPKIHSKQIPQLMKRGSAVPLSNYKDAKIQDYILWHKTMVGV